MRADLFIGDALTTLRTMPDESVHCCVTSPPYWALRDYGVDGQLGLEPTPEAYVEKLVDVFAEVRRVLRTDGTLWLDLGDSYTGNASPGGEESRTCAGRPNARDPIPITKRGGGLKSKDLVGIPWRTALALQADGWTLRADVVWHKPNAMPQPAKDRPSVAHEYVFLLAKSARYYFDADAIREKTGREATPEEYEAERRSTWPSGGLVEGAGAKKRVRRLTHPLGRNARSVWTIATEASPIGPDGQRHFAAFPRELARRCILAGCPPRGVVLDPFAGTCTVAEVAIAHGREFLGVELNPAYVPIAKARVTAALKATQLAEVA